MNEMINLIVYGSLINKTELLNKKIKLENCVPIILNGFKREFSQEPSWRKVDSNYRAVLTVFPSPHHKINAILIKDLPKDIFQKLDEREIGYDRIKISASKINFAYEESTSIKEAFIYIGKKEKYNKSIYPNLEYLKLCSDGAKGWSEEFHNDFLQTTK